MKKTFLFVLLGGMLFTSARAQNAYYDALTLSSYLDANGKLDTGAHGDEIIQILQAYTRLAGVQTTRTQINQRYSGTGNTFITDFIPTTGLGGGGTPSLRASGALSSVGGINVSTVADGLAQFLVERAKAELNIVFFQRFKKVLDKQYELRILFPQTFNVLSVVESQIYNFSVFQASFRTAVEKDINSLPLKLKDLVADPRFDAKLSRVLGEKSESIKFAFGGAFLVAKVLDGEHPADLLNQVASSGDVVKLSGNVSNGLKLANMISQSLIAKSGSGSRWVSSSELEVLLRDTNALKIYVGLLYQLGRDIEFTSGSATPGSSGAPTTFSFQNLIKRTDSAITQIRSLIETFTQYADAFKSVGDALTGASNEANLIAEFHTISDATLTFFKSGIELRTRLMNEESSPSEQAFLRLLSSVNNLSLHLKQKQYGAIATDLVAILDVVVDKDVFKKYRSKLLTYSSFMVTVVEAKTAAEVKQAIEAFALPVGSASIKKYSTWSVGLNAFVGGFAGYERLEDVSADQKLNLSPFANASDRVYGMAAPVGIAASYGFGKSSISLFVSLIDIGAVTAFRLNSDTTATLPEIKLQNIFAPGLHLICGLPGVPVSLSLGGQLGPGLRKVAVDEIEIDASGFRYGIALTVDIPLINFFQVQR